MKGLRSNWQLLTKNVILLLIIEFSEVTITNFTISIMLITFHSTQLCNYSIKTRTIVMPTKYYNVLYYNCNFILSYSRIFIVETITFVKVYFAGGLLFHHKMITRLDKTVLSHYFLSVRV